MQLERTAKATMTPFGLNHGDRLTFIRCDGEAVDIELLDTKASILEEQYRVRGYAGTKGDISVYGFSCHLRVNGEEIEIKREVGSQKSFYEPLAVAGVHIWLDAVQDIFDISYGHIPDKGGFMIEKDALGGAVCMPESQARFVIQDAELSVCPEPMGKWCVLPEDGIRMENCYNGEDCWMGPYGGAFAHCGLDINMPSGSKLYAPIAFDTQYYIKSVKARFRNNKWAGFRTWDDKSVWCLSTSHIIDALVDEHIPVKQGAAYATTAGTAVGAHEHTHFNLQITEQGGSYMLDPWILFWQIARDQS